MEETHRPIPVPAEFESFFDGVISDSGGKRVREIAPDVEQGPNADYVFDEHQYFAELKTIESDAFNDQPFQKKIADLYQDWVRRRLMPPIYGTIRINTDSLPKNLATEFFEIFRRRFDESYIRKANRQLRNTKQLLGKPNYGGLLILANLGAPLLTPHLANYLLNRLVRGGRSDVTHVIYFSVGLTMSLEGPYTRGIPWCDSFVEEETAAPRALIDAIRMNWQSKFNKFLGEEIPSQLLDDPNLEMMSKARLAAKNTVSSVGHIRPKKIYHDPEYGNLLYCVEVETATAIFILVESYTPDGHLIQIKFSRPLGTCDILREVKDGQILEKCHHLLSPILKKIDP